MRVPTESAAADHEAVAARTHYKEALRLLLGQPRDSPSSLRNGAVSPGHDSEKRDSRSNTAACPHLGAEGEQF